MECRDGVLGGMVEAQSNGCRFCARGPLVACANLFRAHGRAKAARVVGALTRGGAAPALAPGGRGEGGRLGGAGHGGGRRREGWRIIRAVGGDVVDWLVGHG